MIKSNSKSKEKKNEVSTTVKKDGDMTAFEQQKMSTSMNT